MAKNLFLYIITIFSLNGVDEYHLKCPGQSQWMTRAKSVCSVSHNYVCLHSPNGYVEQCLKPEPEHKGREILWRGNLDARDCDHTHYQPFIFWTNGSSGCIFQKSFCNQEGQVIYDNRDPETDISCRCDYRRGYAFVVQPKKTCYCFPSEEDCTCYKKSCDGSKRTLSQDYECEYEQNISNLQFSCPALNRTHIFSTDNIIENTVEVLTTETGIPVRFHKCAGIAVLGSCILSGLSIFLMIYRQRSLKLSALKAEQKTFYQEQLMNQEEKRRYIRIVIIGQKGAGKTCLLRRLLKENIAGVQSTDGIDIEIAKCKIRSRDGKWKICKGKTYTNQQKILDRFRRNIVEENLTKDSKISTAQIACDSVTFDENITQVEAETGELMLHGLPEKSDNGSNQTHSVISIKRDDHPQRHFVKEDKDESVQRSSEIETFDETKDFQAESSLKYEKNLNDLLEELVESAQNYDLSEDEYLECGLWDFAGEKDYYATHQAFLSSACIVILVADITKPINKLFTDTNYDSIGEFIDFWLDSIHLFAVQGATKENLEPPVIIVGTHIDNIQENLDKKIEQFKTDLRELLKDHNKRKHIVSQRFLSNTKSPEQMFEELRQTVFQVAKRMTTWNKSTPLNWIPLEKVIDFFRLKVNVLEFNVLMGYAKKLCKIEENEEVVKFLEYQNEVGNIIFCSDLPKHIILNPKWLVDAFRCLVSNKVPDHIENSDEWTTLKQIGEILPSLLERLFDIPELNSDQKMYILDVLEKWNIIIRPKVTGVTLDKYYIPFMITKKPSVQDIRIRLSNEPNNFIITPWFLLQFEFLPIAFFNHIFFEFVRKYEVAVDAETGKPAFYHSIGVFILDEKKQKLFLCFSRNTVAMQLDVKRGENMLPICHKIRSELETVVENIEKRCKVHLKYSVYVKCSKDDYVKMSGRVAEADISVKDSCCEKLTSDELSIWCDHKPALQTECTGAIDQEYTDRKEDKASSNMSKLISYKLVDQFQIKGTRIYDIVVNQDGSLLIADGGKDEKNGKLLIYNFLGKKIRSMDLPGKPYCIAILDNAMIAVTMPYQNEILIVNTVQWRIQNVFKIGKFCAGVMYMPSKSPGRLIIVTDKTLEIFDEKKEVIEKSFKLPGFTSDNLFAGKDCIYCTEHNRVIRIDMEANILSTYSGVEGTIEPRGLTMDDDGFLLVAYSASHNVCRISPDFKSCEIVITDIPDKQWSPFICFDTKSKSIIIGRKDTVYLYRKRERNEL